MMPDAIVVEKLGKRFRRYHADTPGTLHESLTRGFKKFLPAERFWGLRDVSLRVPRGRTLGLIGRNGAGKSTLLRLIGGVGRADEGHIEVHGRLGALLHLGAGFHGDLTGRENTFINGVIGGLTRGEVAGRFDSIVSFAELEDFIDSPLRTYSSGMQMRLAFSIAIHSTPDILLIDEVLAVGDIAFQRKCLDRIAELKDKGCTIILVSHDVTMVQQFCDDALWLQNGGTAAQGDSETVIQRYLCDADLNPRNHAVNPAGLTQYA
jgi:lipopolysaccharide transport system ATP-binding protein